MKKYYLAALILALLQLTLPIFFLMVIPIMIAILYKRDNGAILWLAFVSGLAVDLFGSKYLGVSSIFLMMLIGIVSGVESKFQNSAKISVGIMFLAGFVWPLLFRFLI